MYESPVTQHNLLQVESENKGSSEKIPKSIYLDWNIFQDIIQDRNDERLLENLASARARGFDEETAGITHRWSAYFAA